MAKQMIIPVFIPHQGCDNDCVFCNQRKIAGDYQIPDGEQLAHQVMTYRRSVADVKDYHIQLAFYGGSFTGLPIALQQQLLGWAQTFKQKGLIDKIRLSTRPDYINQAIVDGLVHYNVDIVELGVQSLNGDVLKASKRGHYAQHVYEANGYLRQTSLQVGMQLMLGLPEDEPAISLDTAKKVVALGPDFVRLYPTVVIKETELAQMWQQGSYVPWSEEQVIDTLAQMVQLFQQADIPVIRIGLQAADNLQYGQDILAGFYHPAMGEMVKSRLFLKQIMTQLEGKQFDKQHDIQLNCNPKDYSQVCGQKKSNLQLLEDKYQLKANMIVDQSLPRGAVKVTFAGQ